MSTIFDTARGTVHAWQCDHMGHANLRVYGDFFEQALWQVFQEIGITPSQLRSGAISMAGVQQNIGYKKELFAGDVIVVRSQLIEINERSLKMRHEMTQIETNAVCAVCELTAVCIDTQTRKPCQFPQEIATRGLQLIDG
ncbi:MAG: acyl-CoA thioesterase [Burkholderiales bacterium]